MGRPVAVDGPSLDRLKALKSWSSFELQIREAQQLCTHSARADMILKWVLEKMTDSDDAIRTVQLWDVLQSTLRLLLPGRIAILLGPVNILAVVERALADEEDAGEVFQSIATSLRLLLDLSDSTKGVPIKAAISLDAVAAAKFVEAWMRQCYYHAKDISQNSSIAVRVWNLRSRHVDEHKLFSERCLLWVTTVLATSQLQSTKTSLKRKRNKDSFAVDRDLEALIARHVVLPARAYYVNAQDQKFTKRQTEQKHQSGLRQLLAPFQSVDKSLLDDEAFQTTWYAGIPLLLDLALRCVPAPTLKHRVQEKPWVEFVFSCISDCVGPDDIFKTNSVKAHVTLLGMLSVIEKRTALSTETLRKVVRVSILDEYDNCDVNKEGKHSGDTEMVLREAVVNRVLYKIIELDASVFLDRPLLEALCAHIRNLRHVESSDQDITNRTFNDVSQTEKLRTPHVVQRLVLEPIMQAFARERKTDDFVDIWYGQLQQCAELDILAAWEDLGDAFAAYMEVILTEQQIVDLLDRFMAELERSHSSGDSLGLTNLPAVLSVLRSIVRGVQSEQLVSIVHSKVGVLLRSLLRLLESTDEEAQRQKLDHSEVWRLCTSTFELWYPRQVNTEAEITTLESNCEKLLSTNLVHRALGVSYESNAKSTRQSRAFKAAQQAITFVACLCHHSGGADGNNSNVQAFTRQIVKRTYQDLVALPGLLCYPSVLMLMNEKQRSSLLNEVLDQFEGSPNDATLSMSIRALCKLTTTLPVVAAQLLIGDIIAATSKRTKLIHDSGAGSVHYSQMVAVLNALPYHVLAKSQIGSVIDTLISDSSRVMSNDQSQLESRLSLIIRLLADRSLGASICTDATSFWSLAELTDRSGQSSNDNNVKVYVMLSRLACLVMKQLFDAYSREESRKVLQDIGDGMRHAISDARAKLENKTPATSMSAIGILALSAGIFQAVRDRTNQVVKDMVFQPSLLDDYIETVSLSFSNCKKLADEKNHSYSCMAHLVESLVSLQTTIRSMGLNAQGKQIQQVLSIALPDLPFIATPELSIATTQDVIELTDGALNALHQKAQPQQATRVVMKFRELCVTQLTAGQRTAVVHHLLSSAEAETTVSALTLANAAVSAIGKIDQEDDDFSGRQTILRSALQIALSSNTATEQQATLRLITTILREKPFLTDQSTVESTVSCLQALASRQNIESVVYLELCSILTLLFQQFRSRISDRMHLVVGLLQALITSLSRNTKGSQALPGGAIKPPTSRQAHALARCLQLFCDPPPARPNPKSATTPSLVDSSRRAQAQVGQYIPYVLHHYCTQVLSGSAAPGVRDTLKPGLWGMINAMEISDESAVRTLSWAMNVSERAVLRGLYEEWKSSGKWSGN